MLGDGRSAFFVNDLGRGAIVSVLCIFEIESHDTGVNTIVGVFDSHLLSTELIA